MNKTFISTRKKYFERMAHSPRVQYILSLLATAVVQASQKTAHSLSSLSEGYLKRTVLSEGDWDIQTGHKTASIFKTVL